MPRIKYMGTADVRYIQAGNDFGGRLATPTPKDVVWDQHNNFIVDTDELGLSSEAVELLLTDSEFLSVEGMEKIPLSEGDKMFRGMRDAPASGDLPPGFTSVGSIPTSQASSTAPEAKAFASTVTSAPDPVVKPTDVAKP